MDSLQQIINQIPSSWRDITVDHYQFINEVQFESEDGFLSKTLKAVEVLCGIHEDDDVFDELTVSDIKTLSTRIDFLKHLPTNVNFEIDNYSLINFNKITCGQYIDIEFWLEDITPNLHKIMATIYQQCKYDEWGNKIYEPYIYDINKRSEVFSELPMSNVYGAVDYYLQWREKFIEDNKSIFEKEDADDEQDLNMFSKEEQEEIKQDIEKEKIKQKYAWPYFLHQLADGDIVKMKEMLNLNLLYVINMYKMKKLFNG
jgi:hypothetical protein